MLTQLLSVDYDLIMCCEEIRDAASALTLEGVAAAPDEDHVEGLIAGLDTILRTRQMILQFH